MKVLLKSSEVIDNSPSKKNKQNILIEDGIISEISDKEPSADLVIESTNQKVSIGWMDFNAFLNDPGSEFKEDLISGALAAAYGGFTEVVCQPNTTPIIQDKNSIIYYTSGNKDRLVQLRPLGAVTLNTQGLELTEMLDMYHSGAVAFSDGLKSINNTDIILKSLLYLSKIDALFINHPDEAALSSLGVVHEGITSTMMGLRGIPSIAEEIAIIRDLKLLEYSGGRIHFSNISCAQSVDLIREAKRKNMAVTCDIAAHQVAFNDTSIKSFDTNLKVNPPFRSQTDIDALWNGLKDGTIDLIVSSHRPQDEESKKLEFDLAEYGIIGLETAFSIINTLNKTLSLEQIIDKLAYKPREILKTFIPEIKVGEVANLTVFDPDLSWTYLEKNIVSKSKNSPFINYAFKGMPLAVFNNRKHFINPGLEMVKNLQKS